MAYLTLALCLILSFLLSGLESAVIAVSRVRVRHAASSGDARARGLLPLLEDRDALLGCITVANHIINLIAFLLVALPLIQHASIWESALVFFISLPCFLIGLEIMPKKLFRRFPFRSLRKVAPLLHVIGIARPLFRAFTPAKTDSNATPQLDTNQTHGRSDLKQLAGTLATQQQLSAPAARLIEHILDYSQSTAADLMQPLSQSIALAADFPISAALIVAREQQTALLPVLGTDGAFIGVLDTAELPATLPPDRLVQHHMRTLDVVHAADTALHTLQRLRKQGRRLAVVLDTHHHPIGLISEDLLLAPLM